MSKPELVFFCKMHQQVQKLRQKEVSELQGFEKTISAACCGLAVNKLWIFEHEPPPVSGVILGSRYRIALKSNLTSPP
jgi:hypothetical protein